MLHSNTSKIFLRLIDVRGKKFFSFSKGERNAKRYLSKDAVLRRGKINNEETT